MPRKRGSRRTYIKQEQVKKPATKKEKKKIYFSFILIALFCLVLFFNSYFNYTSEVAHNPDGDTFGTRFYLSGPDPYYNLRLCQITLETGEYPFVELSDGDPLLNYPVGVYAGARPPLFNMLAVGATHLVSGVTGMEQMEALGWCMLFLPAIYGALLVFPVYGIGKELFNRKVGIMAALFIPLIPIHLGSGHGSAFSLFDHDSFILLLFAFTFWFTIKALKQQKNIKKGIFYSMLAGLAVACIELTWVAGQVLFLMLILYLIVQLVFDIFNKRTNDITKPLYISIILGFAFIITLPYTIAVSQAFNSHIFYTSIAALAILGLYLFLNKLKMPWIVSIPTMGIIGGAGLGFLWVVSRGIISIPGPIENIARTIFGEGIYGYQVSATIGEAHTYGLSQTVMSFGPALYWLGLAGFTLYLFKTYKDKWSQQNIFIIVIFFTQFWFTTVAGRFLNDLIPTVCVFAGFTIVLLLKKVDFKQMFQNMKALSGFKKIRKGIKISHLMVVLFLLGAVIFPNVYLSLDAAVPAQHKEEYFGEDYRGYFGLYLGQQYYWSDACKWLAQQDTEYETDAERPGVLTWWDYGFYLVSMSKHPTVADNYQEGLRCAGNFHTAQNEKEATSVLIIRLVEGVKSPMRLSVGKIPEETKNVIRKYFDDENATTLIGILEDPISNAPSYNTLISPEYGNDYLRVDDYNSMYHDATDILVQLSDYQITKLYHELMKQTGYQIRYYGIEQRDLFDIFGVFPFLSDKGTHGYASYEDDWYYTYYLDKLTGNKYTPEELNNFTRAEINEMDIATITDEKDTYYNSMAYKAFFGYRDEDGGIPDNRIPGYLLTHWFPAFVSPYISILKYYEGVNITGTVKVGPIGYDGTIVYFFDEYNIPHGYSIVQNGQFDVLGLPGNSSLKLLIQGEVVAEQSIGEISEEEATWEVESNYTVDFNIDYANVNITLSGVNETANLTMQSTIYEQEFRDIADIENTAYSLDLLPPSYYRFEITNETGVRIHYEEIFLKPGDNNVNLVVEGTND